MSKYQLKRSTPQKQGVKPEAVMNFINELEQSRLPDMSQDIHSFMLLRHGYVIAEGSWEPYRMDIPHALFSLSKSFTSTAIGIAAFEGLLSVEDLVVSYFKKECPYPTDLQSKMCIKHLLTMSTGQAKEPTNDMLYREDGDWVKTFFEASVEKEPGTEFLYNSGATYILSVILQRVTGFKVVEYLKPRLFEPLGIENPVWKECPMGYNAGGFGLNLKTEDIAKLGQLYLNKGLWDGKRILPEKWVDEAVRFHISNGGKPDIDWCQGYVYQFWRCTHDSYRGDGAFGQYSIVMPKFNMVLAITGGLSNMQKPLNFLWDNILPGITDEVSSEAEQYECLSEKLTSLKVLMPIGQSTSHLSQAIADKRFQLNDNQDKFDHVAFHFYDDYIQMIICSSEQEQVLKIGIGHWMENYLIRKGYREHVFMTGIWKDSNTLLIQCRFIETPYAFIYQFVFDNQKVSMSSKINVTFGDAKVDEELCR
jgi:hypothetical protein